MVEIEHWLRARPGRRTPEGLEVRGGPAPPPLWAKGRERSMDVVGVPGAQHLGRALGLFPGGRGPCPRRRRTRARGQHRRRPAGTPAPGAPPAPGPRQAATAGSGKCPRPLGPSCPRARGPPPPLARRWPALENLCIPPGTAVVRQLTSARYPSTPPLGQQKDRCRQHLGVARPYAANAMGPKVTVAEIQPGPSQLAALPRGGKTLRVTPM